MPIKSFIRRKLYTVKIFSYRQFYLLKVPKFYKYRNILLQKILHKYRNFIFSTVLIIYLLFPIILYLLTQPRSKFPLVENLPSSTFSTISNFTNFKLWIEIIKNARLNIALRNNKYYTHTKFPRTYFLLVQSSTFTKRENCIFSITLKCGKIDIPVNRWRKLETISNN